MTKITTERLNELLNTADWDVEVEFSLSEVNVEYDSPRSVYVNYVSYYLNIHSKTIIDGEAVGIYYHNSFSFSSRKDADENESPSMGIYGRTSHGSVSIVNMDGDELEHSEVSQLLLGNSPSKFRRIKQCTLLGVLGMSNEFTFDVDSNLLLIRNMEGMEQYTTTSIPSASRKYLYGNFPDEPSISFIGSLVVNSVMPTSFKNTSKKRHWIRLELYKTIGGNFVARKLGLVPWVSKHIIYKNAVCENEKEIVAFFGRSYLAKEVYKKAGIIY